MGVFLLDNFTEASGQLTAHTPDTGAAWTRLGSNTGGFTNNRARNTTAGSTSRHLSGATPGDADYTTTAVLHRISTLNYFFSVLVRADSTNGTSFTNGYRLQYQAGTTNAWVLRRIRSGTVETLTGNPSNYSDTTWSVGTDRTIVITLTGNNITITIDGVTAFNVNDTTNGISAAGTVGLEMDGSASHGIHIDSVSSDDGSSGVVNSTCAAIENEVGAATVKADHIEGTVTLSGSAQSGVTVRAVNTTDESYAGDATTNASGQYVIKGLNPTKTYHVTAEYDNGTTQYQAKSVPFVSPVQP